MTSTILYPAVMAFGLGLHVALATAGVPIGASSYAAVATATAVILLLERRRPYRRSWRADPAEMRGDVAYLVLVQVALPVALALATARVVADARGGGATAATPWPHRWPIPAQFALLLVLADLLRYALHVAAHRSPTLWRLHAIHHAPKKLYALNVGRFHPIERTLQYALEVLPFALVGVDPRVLALYVVFHSLHGFWQHANVDVRLGPLNWILSGPELHRWHHSTRPNESQANYANHLALWDLAFGTYTRPRGREVEALGVDATLGASRGTDVGVAALAIAACASTARRCADAATAGLVRLQMAALHWRAWRPVAAATADPRAAQLAVLRRIVVANRDTEFGRRHRFDAIASVDDFRTRVPIHDYESLRPWIETQERTGTPCLTRERPVLYAQTSGTTGTPKYLPLTGAALAELRRTQALFAYLQYRSVPAALGGRILAVVGPAVEGTLPGGAPYGSASGHLYATLPRIARRKYVVPPAVFAAPDPLVRYLAILRLALADEGITALAAANPSTFLRLADVLRAHRAELVHDLERAAFGRLGALPDEARRAMARRLRCSRARAAAVRRILARDDVGFGDLWPRLAAVTTWTGGSCGIALARVRALLPPRVRLVELGYVASECRGTVTLDCETRAGLPTLRDVFFEFVARDAWERGERSTRGLDELADGGEYYVIVTTASGLYRYAMHDIVRVCGRYEATPMLAFVQKGVGVTSITGEKLYESQVLDAVATAQRELGCAARFFLVLADVERARYRLLLERDAAFAPDVARLAERVDALLADSNVEYADKRASGRLTALEARLVRAGFGEAYRSWCVARGQRDAQFKTVALQYAHEFRFTADVEDAR